MAVGTASEMPEGRTASNRLGIRTYQRKFRVKTTDKNDDAFAVGSAAGLPLIGSRFYDGYCTQLDVENDEPWAGWTVTASYTTEEEFATNPLNDPAKFEWLTEQFQIVVAADKDGDAVVNSAGDPFDPPALRDQSRRVVRVRKNLATVPAWLLDYEDAVNDGAFTVDGFAVATGKGKCQRVQVSEEQSRNGTAFREVSYELHLSRDGWDLSILDAGFREKDGSNRINILNDGDSLQPTAPILLDGSGAQLSDPTVANAVFLDFEVYPELPFGGVLPGL